METKPGYGGLDLFKPLAALLVIAIHTSPLASFSAGADFFLTRVLARLAVPFFFMVTGHFVLSRLLLGGDRDFTPVWRYLKKILLLYGLAILLYFPIGVYAGHYSGLNPASALRMLLFDGTFYHLWYFPALLLGIPLLCLLRRFFPLKITAVIAAALYLLGLLGDSYWGVISGLPGISAAYEGAFGIFTYTRNGLFLAPLFLVMGAWLGQKKGRGRPAPYAAGFAASLLLMTAEGFLLRHFEVQRHDSMYLLLPVCMFFLYRLLLLIKRKPCKALRTASSWIYLLHPAMIVAVRGAAKISGMTALLVENSLIHFLAVCVSSVLAAFAVTLLCGYWGRRPSERGRAWIELDRAALRQNVAVLRGLLPKSCALMPAVKADAYGHGAGLIARELNRMGVKAFCTACVWEAVALRRQGVKGEILILGYTHPKDFPLLRHYRLTQTVLDYPYAAELEKYGKRLRVHVGIDTGMHRLGERCEHFDQLIKIFGMKKLRIDGVYTHLCAGDREGPEARDFTLKQAKAFFSLTGRLREQGFSCPKIHLQASGGVLNYPELAGDYARVGIALYGVRSTRRDLDGSAAGLRPILSLKARVAAVKELFPGETAGYGLTFTAERPMKIATLAIGYADGFPRALSHGGGAALLNGCRAPVVGSICMDQTIVDITGIPDVCAGDTAVLIGQSGGETISVYEIAEAAGTITNEVLSRLGGRLPRRMEEGSPPIFSGQDG